MMQAFGAVCTAFICARGIGDSCPCRSPTLQIFEYVLDYLRSRRFGDCDDASILPRDERTLALLARCGAVRCGTVRCGAVQELHGHRWSTWKLCVSKGVPEPLKSMDGLMCARVCREANFYQLPSLADRARATLALAMPAAHANTPSGDRSRAVCERAQRQQISLFAGLINCRPLPLPLSFLLASADAPAYTAAEGSAHAGQLMQGRFGGSGLAPAQQQHMDALFLETGFVDAADLPAAQASVLSQLNSKVTRRGWVAVLCTLLPCSAPPPPKLLTRAPPLPIPLPDRPTAAAGGAPGPGLECRGVSLRRGARKRPAQPVLPRCARQRRWRCRRQGVASAAQVTHVLSFDDASHFPHPLVPSYLTSMPSRIYPLLRKSCNLFHCFSLLLCRLWPAPRLYSCILYQIASPFLP